MTAHGISSHQAIIYEVGQLRSHQDAFIEAIETSQGAYDDSLLIAIFTQAAADDDLFIIWLNDAEAVDDKRIVLHFYSAPKDCKVLDRKAWKITNPALDEFRALKDL